MEPRLKDPDLTLYAGDALAVLRELPAESIDCCVTSPPYFGLRDYGAEGQVGLEATPALYVAKLVEIFREVRRVLAPHGTVWLNLGDSYASGGRDWYESDDGGPGGRGHAKRPDTPPGLKAKDLIGIPWRVAFALQEDGWWLRSDIIWHKPNAMPSSVRDRPTTSHEYVFLLSKQARYYFDREAVLEPAAWERWGNQTVPKYEGTESATGWIKPQSKEKLVKRRSVRPGIDTHGGGQGNGVIESPASGKNIRSVWTIPTQPYPEAHFATFPEELPRRCIAAGCPEQVCRKCGKPRTRIVESESVPESEKNKPGTYDWHPTTSDLGGQKMQDWRDAHPPKTVGWTDCGHGTVRCTCCNTTYAHVLRGNVRDVREAVSKSQSKNMLAEVRSAASGEGGSPAFLPEEEREVHEQPRVRDAVSAGSPDGDRAGEEVGSGASVRDGRASGADTVFPGDGPPPQRSEGRQSSGESRARGEDSTSRPGGVPTLPPHIQCEVDRCACGGDLEYITPNYRPGVVLDPFAGAGTTALVARSLARHSLLIELSPEYCDLIATRLQQLSLLA